MFLVDTNVLSDFQKERPRPQIVDWVTGSKGNLAICWALIVEIQRGIVNLGDRNPEKAAALRRWLHTLWSSDFQFQEMCPASCITYGCLTMHPQLKDLWMPNPNAKNNKMSLDLVFASISIGKKLPMATSNVKDFLRVHEYFPLPGLFNPTTGDWVIPAPAYAVEGTNRRGPSLPPELASAKNAWPWPARGKLPSSPSTVEHDGQPPECFTLKTKRDNADDQSVEEFRTILPVSYMLQ